MKEELKASVQYGDLRGEVACDGHQGILLHELAKKAKLPDRYFPLAVSVYLGEHGTLDVDLFACQVASYGSSVDEIRRKGDAAGEIDVEKFRLKIEASDLLKLVKRLDILAQHRGVAGIRLVASDSL